MVFENKESGKTQAKNLGVLFVEDSREDAELLAWELEKAGYALHSRRRVETLPELRDALSSERDKWDLVISDYALPSFTGLDALALIRRLRPHMPFIMVSGTIGEEQAADAVKAGADDYVMKGNSRRLGLAVDRVLREKQAQREKEAVLKILRLIQFSIDNCSELMVWLGSDGKILQVNDAACRTLGYTLQEMLSLKAWELNPDWTPEKFRSDWRLLRLGRSLFRESGILAKDGRGIDSEIICNHVPFDDDEFVLALIRDVREKKRVEEELKRSEDLLRQSQRMETVGRLAGGISHDFNNILFAISGYANLLQLKLAQSGIVHRELDEIEKAVMKAASLIRQLLTFSRQQKVVNHQALSLEAVIHETESMLRVVLGEGIVLKTRVEKGLSKIHADHTQLEQVIMNLAVNARDAMAGNGRFDLDAFPCVLDRGHFRAGEKAAPGKYVCLRIRDTGCGMSEEIRSRIFEPFFTTKAEGQGTGLGLSTVYGIVQQAGGNIRVESIPGKGSAFSVYLHAYDEDKSDSAELRKQPEP